MHTKTANVPTCKCLGRHAELLLRLKDLEAQQRPRIDVLLVFAKTGIEAWQSLIDCSVCQENDDQEALLLTAMCIRVFVRSLRTLCQSNEHNFDGGSANILPRNNIRPASSRDRNCNLTGSSTFSSKSAHVKRKSDYRHELAATGSLGTRPHHSSTSTTNARTKLGMFEITGSDRTVVGKVILSRALEQIQIVLVGLKKRAAFEQRDQRNQPPMNFEQACQLGMMNHESEAAADFAGATEAEDDEEHGNIGLLMGFFNSLEAMVLELRRDLHVDLNPALDSGGGAAYYQDSP